MTKALTNNGEADDGEYDWMKIPQNDKTRLSTTQTEQAQRRASAQALDAAKNNRLPPLPPLEQQAAAQEGLKAPADLLHTRSPTNQVAPSNMALPSSKGVAPISPAPPVNNNTIPPVTNTNTTPAMDQNRRMTNPPPMPGFFARLFGRCCGFHR